MKSFIIKVKAIWQLLTIAALLFANDSISLAQEVPIGTVVVQAGSATPSGWLLCDGSAVSRSSYSGLFTVLGTAFGSGNGSTTFNLPDMRGRFSRGANPTGVNSAPASTIGTFQNDMLQAHSHAYDSSSGTLASCNTVGNHSHTHDHPSMNSTSTSFDHTHNAKVSTGNNTTNHTHTLNSAGAHTHSFSLFNPLQAVMVNGGSASTNIWVDDNQTTAITVFDAVDHTHQLQSDGTNYTHTLSGTIPYTATSTSHTHSITLSLTNSSSGGSHTHTLAGSSGNTTSTGDGSETRPDNVSFNFIIKY